jgi:hypothetical protein
MDILDNWILDFIHGPYSKDHTRHSVSETGSVYVLRWGGSRHALCWARWEEITSVTGKLWLCVTLKIKRQKPLDLLLVLVWKILAC